MSGPLGFSRVVAMLYNHKDLEAILVLKGKDNEVCGDGGDKSKIINLGVSFYQRQG